MPKTAENEDIPNFKTRKYLSAATGFEDLISIVDKIKFKWKTNSLQKTLATEVENIKQINNYFCQSWQNWKPLHHNPEDIQKKLTNEVTTHYKKNQHSI